MAIAQGAQNAGKYLAVGDDGNVTPISGNSGGITAIRPSITNGNLTISATNPDGTKVSGNVPLAKSLTSTSLSSLITCSFSDGNNSIIVNREFDIEYIYQTYQGAKTVRVTVSPGTYQDTWYSHSIFYANTYLGIASMDDVKDCSIQISNTGSKSVKIKNNTASQMTTSRLTSTANKAYYRYRIYV